MPTTAEKKTNRFIELNSIDVSGKTEKKNGLTYLSWAWAWTEFKKRYPDSYYTVYENSDGWPYFTDGKTCWVKTGVTLVDGDFKLELIEILPIMDFKNKSVPVDNVDSMQMNKSIQRCLTKAIARHGVGLFVYAGEDMPEEDEEVKAARLEEEAKAKEACEELIKSIAAKLAATVKGMPKEEQIEFANTVIKPIVGTVQYKTCTDPNKLKELLTAVENYKA